MIENLSSSQFQHLFFLQKENYHIHLTNNKELQFYNAIKNGNIDFLNKIMEPFDNHHLEILSGNPLRNMQYHLTIMLTLITYFCIEGGMDEKTANILSSIHIQKMDSCTTVQQIIQLHHDIVFDYASRMQQIHKKNRKSPAVIQCIDYIYQNLHNTISIDDLAAYTNKNATYLCGLFKKEMNITIGNFIRNKRIEAAENMLKFSDYDISDISKCLGFTSYSYFINVFKKSTGFTPREYRKINF